MRKLIAHSNKLSPFSKVKRTDEYLPSGRIQLSRKKVVSLIKRLSKHRLQIGCQTSSLRSRIRKLFNSECYNSMMERTPPEGVFGLIIGVGNLKIRRQSLIRGHSGGVDSPNAFLIFRSTHPHGLEYGWCWTEHRRRMVQGGQILRCKAPLSEQSPLIQNWYHVKM